MKNEINTIKGVNLGNWLVLEKWMKPSMFADVEAEDETWLCRRLSEEEKESRYHAHRSSYITREDFSFLAAHGFNAVRLPIPYFVLESQDGFLSCAQQVEDAMNWAKENGIQILLDLHTVPGGHNGTDNSGICGVCKWSVVPENRMRTLEILEGIAKRWGLCESLWGIEVINEPMCSDAPWGQYMSIQALSTVYPPEDPEEAKGSDNYTLAYLRDFYRDAYRVMRKHMPVEKKIVFSDAFWLDCWDDFYADPSFEGIVMDTHQYLAMPELAFGETRSIEKYEAHLHTLASQLAKVSEKFPVIVGEWSLSSRMTDLDGASQEEKERLIKRLADSYLNAVSNTLGWFYWNYRIDAPEEEKMIWDVHNCLPYINF